jgi:hypothetical protein
VVRSPPDPNPSEDTVPDRPSPATPLGDRDDERTSSASEGSSEPTDPDASHATLRERGPGGHEEKLGDDPNLRADDTAPGVDPDDGDA